MKYVESEKQNNETFVGNIETERDLSYLKDVKYRTGKQAIDIHGVKIDPAYMIPLFISNESLSKYDQIMLNHYDIAVKRGK